MLKKVSCTEIRVRVGYPPELQKSLPWIGLNCSERFVWKLLSLVVSIFTHA